MLWFDNLPTWPLELRSNWSSWSSLSSNFFEGHRPLHNWETYISKACRQLTSPSFHNGGFWSHSLKSGICRQDGVYCLRNKWPGGDADTANDVPRREDHHCYSPHTVTINTPIVKTFTWLLYNPHHKSGLSRCSLCNCSISNKFIYLKYLDALLMKVA